MLGTLPLWLSGLTLGVIYQLVRDGPHPLDTAVTSLVRGHTPSSLEPLLLVLSRMLGLGGWLLWVLGLLLVLSVALLARRRWCEAVGLLVSVAMSSGAVGFARRLFQRSRPDVDWALAQAPSFSFPSGHAASAVVYFGMLAYLLWRLTRHRGLGVAAGALALALVAGTGYSRIYLGVHHPTDVAAGYVVGLIWLATGIITTELLTRVCRASPADISDGKIDGQPAPPAPGGVRPVTG